MVTLYDCTSPAPQNPVGTPWRQLCGLYYVAVIPPPPPSAPLSSANNESKLDTVKSLIQADSLEAPEYRGVVHGFRRAVADGGGGFKGFVSLYRGLSPSVMRSSVGNAVLFLTFETMLDALGR